MPERTRPIRKEICLNETELNLIRHKMRQLGTRNFGACVWKIPTGGCVVRADALGGKAGCRSRLHRTGQQTVLFSRQLEGHFYEADVAELKDRLGDVWELLKIRQKEEL